MKNFLGVLLLVLCLLSPQLVAADSNPYVLAAAGEAAAAGNILTESFDGPGDISCYAGYSSNCDNTWDAIFGTPVFNQEVNKIDGTYSLLVGGATESATLTIGSFDQINIFYKVKLITYVSSGTNNHFTANDLVATLSVDTAGKPSVAFTGGTIQYGSNGDFAENTTYYVWIELKNGAGDGFIKAYWSTDGTKGSAKLSLTNGNDTDKIVSITFKGLASQEVIVDSIIVSETTIGDQ